MTGFSPDILFGFQFSIVFYLFKLPEVVMAT